MNLCFFFSLILLLPNSAIRRESPHWSIRPLSADCHNWSRRLSAIISSSFSFFRGFLFCPFWAMAGASTPIENTTRNDAFNITIDPVFIFRLFILFIFLSYSDTKVLQNFETEKGKAKKIRNGERKDQKNWFFIELQKKIKISIRNRGFGNTQNIKTNKKT